MFKIEIKSEFDESDHSQCRACLSISRKLTPIGKYYDMFCKLLVDNPYEINISSEIQLCWECLSLVQKCLRFKQQVLKANELIRLGQNYMYGTLTSLTTVIINDTYPNIIYVNETNIQSNNDKKNLPHNDESDDSINDNEAIINNEEIGPEIDVKDESISKEYINNKDIVKVDETTIESTQKPVKVRVKYKNKWAEKRALQNKKPKFKIISNEELVIEKYRRKVKIDVEAIKKCMEKEKLSKRFIKSRFKCESCVKMFTNEKMLLKHKDMFHNEGIGEYTCDVCHKMLPNKTKLLNHINRHCIKYECTLCIFGCKNKNDIAAHLVGKHKKVFQCLKCELSFVCRQDFFKHYKEWHEKFICDMCGVSFKMRYCIKDHIKKQHTPFECKPCNKRFSRYNGLWFHRKVCHTMPSSDGAPAAYCVECDKRFPDVYRYKWHLHNSVKHTPKKKVRIPCPECEKVFSKNIYMKDHYNLVHLKNFKYRCEECDKNFVRNADLVKHRRRIHEGILPPKNKICYICGRGFTTNEILTHHLRTHSRSQPRNTSTKEMT